MSAPKQTQEERRRNTQKRILDATVASLVEVGYANTTVEGIAVRAGVSRGAPIHHFSNKAGIIEAAAKRLIRHTYRELGEAVTRIASSDERLNDLIFYSWHEVFAQPSYASMRELLVASQRDKELASILQSVWTTVYLTLGEAADHYLEPIQEGATAHELMTLTQWLLRGMAEDIHLISDPERFEHHLRLWCQLLALQLRARPNVTEPPAKPPKWDAVLKSPSSA